MKQKNLIRFFLFLFSSILVVQIFSFPAFSQEQITITTYYPAPYGVYKTLRLYPGSQPTTCDAGTIYYNDSQNSLYICNGTSWMPLASGYWTLSANNLYTATGTNNWNVGIGTTSPTAKLQVEGGNLVVSGTGQFNGGALSLSGAGTGILTSAGPVTTWGGNDFKAYSDSGTTQTVQIKGGSGNSYINSGNVGIGTTAPSQKLEVAGQVKIGAYTLPQADGTSGQVLVTDGSGNVGWNKLRATSRTGLVCGYSYKCGIYTSYGSICGPCVDRKVGEVTCADSSIVNFNYCIAN